MKTLLVLCFAVRVAAEQPRALGVVEPVPFAPAILIPAAASAAGANGTFFRSDVTVWNLGATAQSVELRWLPQGGAGDHREVVVSIPARSAIGSEDFVATVVGASGVGAITVTALTESRVPDPGARLYVTSRVWTPQPGTTGTTSQTLPAVPITAVNTTAGVLFGLRRDDRFRVNVGITNLDPSRTQTFEIEVTQTRLGVPPELYTIAVPPGSMQLFNLDATQQQPLFRIDVSNVTPASERSNQWIAYGASVDNVTGDAWSELAIESPFAK